MSRRLTVRYKGSRPADEPTVVRRGGRQYEVSAADRFLSVPPEDWEGWPDKQFFEVMEPPDPEAVRTDEPPLDHPVTIDPADGISDVEAIAAERALAAYRAERLAAKLKRIMDVCSQDWRDYYEAASDG